jgi:hypothetical protein
MRVVPEIHRDGDRDGDSLGHATRALATARDEYRLSGWPGYCQRLPDDAASVQWAFDRLTPLHALATMVGWTFNNLLETINAIGGEDTTKLLQQQRIDQLTDRALYAQNLSVTNSDNGRRGAQHKVRDKTERLVRVRDASRLYRNSPDLQEEYRTEAIYLNKRLGIGLRSAHRYLAEIAAERQ